METTKTIDILRHKGFSAADATTLTHNWVDWMMKHELEMANPHNTNPFYTGLATFGAFLVSGAVLLLPFLLFSCGIPLLALILLRMVPWRVTRAAFQSWWRFWWSFSFEVDFFKA